MLARLLAATTGLFAPLLLTTLLPLLALLFSTTLLALTSLFPLLVLLLFLILLPVLLTLLFTGSRLTLPAPFLLPWALPLLWRASSRSRLSRVAFLILLPILSLPVLTRRTLARVLLSVRAVFGVTALCRRRTRCDRILIPIRWLVSGGLRDLAIELFAEIIELVLGSLQRGGFVAQHAPRRSLDAFAQLLEALSGVPRRLRGILADSKVYQLLRNLQCIGNFLLTRLPHGVIELLGQERLALLRVLDGATHLFEQLIEPFFLLFKTFAGQFSFAHVPQRVPLSLVA